jgi:predicted DCC family thiol-disulfide oxidoreductase YuxK
MDDSKRIILFDGVCNLCNASVNFIIDRDKNDEFVFGSLQSEEAQKLLERYEIPQDYLDSIILIYDGRYFDRSTAALKIASRLSGLWPMLSIFYIVPKALRDWLYDIVADNRYRWFGKQDACRVPTAELKAKFIG